MLLWCIKENVNQIKTIMWGILFIDLTIYYVTFWLSQVKTDTFMKYHIQVYDLKYTIKLGSFMNGIEKGVMYFIAF